jgi:hypothetical protein
MQVRDYFEETPVTMQIAIQARDGFVLASDIKNLIEGHPVHSLAYHTKIAHCEKHAILISSSGYTADPDSEPAAKLAGWLDGCATPRRKEFIEWANKYVAEAAAKNEEDNLRLLILHPAAENDRMFKITIRAGVVRDSPTYQWVVFNGHEDNSAVMWSEFFRCEGKHSLTEATCIAALTILTAGDTNPGGIRGLEIFQYTSKWATLSTSEIEFFRSRYDNLKLYLQGFISAAGTTSQACASQP